MLYHITCAKVFHSFSNFVAGVFCPQKIWRAVKNCALIFMVALLFFPASSEAEELNIVPYAALPQIPEGYEKVDITVTKEVTSKAITFTSSGTYTQPYSYSSSITDWQNLPLSDMYERTLYIRSVTTPIDKMYMRWTLSDSSSWSPWYNDTPDRYITSGKFSFSELSGGSVGGDVNSGLAADIWGLEWANRAMITDYTLHIRHNVSLPGVSQKIQFRNVMTVNATYYVYVGSDTDLITDTIVDAADKIVGSINQNADDIIDNNISNTNKVTSAINAQTQVIIGNINGNTDRILQNQDQNAHDIMQNQDANANKITQNQDENTQKILDQNSQFRDEDRAEAEGIGKIAKDFLDTNTAKVKNNFAILWEPIAFTQRVISVFSGGTKSSVYSRYLDGVVGFTYNPETGCLDPIIDTSPKSRYGKASSGTTITFPSYTLPVLNVKLWDEYTFDIASVKDSYPVLFNAVYVVSGCLCLYWFLGYLSDKFEEVYKE